MNTRARTPAFSLVEPLAALAVLALLLALLLPALTAARDHARTAVCLSHQRQMVLGWSLYAADFADRAMPLGVELPDAVVYWWGAVRHDPPGVVEHARGFLTPYLTNPPGARSVYECPAQPWGTYRPQPVASPPPGQPTSTYGYNGYYLCPPATPGWRLTIGRQPWKRLADIPRPPDLFVFADTLLPATPPMNNALLDPPMLYTGAGAWQPNPFPTTCFRHHGRAPAAVTARADASVHATPARASDLLWPTLNIGSVGPTNDPHYVPDWPRWP